MDDLSNKFTNDLSEELTKDLAKECPSLFSCHKPESKVPAFDPITPPKPTLPRSPTTPKSKFSDDLMSGQPKQKRFKFGTPSLSSSTPPSSSSKSK
jgi:hypothetical protein